MEHSGNVILFSIKKKVIFRYKKTWRKVKYILQSEQGQYEKAIRVWFQLYDILEKEKYGDSKNICGS